MTDHDLSQADIRQAFEAQGDGPWTVVHDEVRADGIYGGSYSALADPGHRKSALDRDSWLVGKGDDAPGFMESYEDGGRVTTYLPRGETDEGLERLVIVREFYGVADTTLEIDQQFRLFHNLRYIPTSNTYMKMNDDGTETLAVRFDGERIEIRTPLLKQYIAARQMDLLLFVDVNVRSSGKPADPGTKRFANATYAGRLDYIGDPYLPAGEYGSRYCATKVVSPGPVETCGIWPYEHADENYPDFIIGEDERGKPVRYTCDPDLLGNYFGGNPDAPHYLTAVHFRREVLAKYYDDPQLYSVGDGYLRCASLWHMQIDNDHEDRVIAFLGDLGRDLPSAERDHWRANNIAVDAPMSQTSIRRSFLAQATDSTAIDLTFRRVYNDATRAWDDRYGWPLFREPRGSDVFLLQQLRVPLNDKSNEFEEAIKLLGKLMSDALNEKAIGKALSEKVPDEKGISKFERFLKQENYPAAERDIQYLRRVQELRSKVSAHLKGRDHEKDLTRILGTARGEQAIRNLLSEGVTFLRNFITWAGPIREEETDEEPVVVPGAPAGPVPEPEN